MTRILYLDCTAGVAGDMLLGALVDGGADRGFVLSQLHGLDLDDWSLSFEETRRAGVRGLKADVRVEASEKRRTYEEVRTIVRSADLVHEVKQRSLDVFATLARAEGNVHGTSPDKAHFHEVGATDAIVDIVGSVAALHSLQVERVISSPAAVGQGQTDTSHGRLPVPAPATLEIFAAASVPIVAGGEGELATPTGAALLANLVDEFGSMPPLTPGAVGHGAGSRERATPNIVRAIVGTAAPDDGDERVVLETNLDDMAPELFPYVIERLLDEGAEDAWVTPIVMKKGRPAFTLSILVDGNKEAAIARIVFKETTTLGLRSSQVQKSALGRDWVVVEIEGHPVQVKIAHFEGTISNAAPEYDDAAAAARASGVPLREVYERAIEQARQQLREPRT